MSATSHPVGPADGDPPEPSEQREPPRLRGVLGVVERAGDRLPHPFWLFWILTAVLAAASAVLAGLGTRTGSGQPIRNLASTTGLTHLLTTMVDNFIDFPPLGVVLAVLFGVGLAERVGLLSAVVSAVLARVPRAAMPLAVTFVAGQGHVMGDASLVILPPLAAVAFLAVGRHPVAGMIGSFASTAAGYASGLLVGALDANLATITGTVVPPNSGIHTSVLMNYYFQVAAGLVLPLLTALILVRWVEPRLPAHTVPDDVAVLDLGVRERRALRRTALAVGVFLLLAFGSWLVPGGPLRGPGGALIDSPFLEGIVPLILLGFLVAGVAYGSGTGAIRSASDVPRLMGEATTGMVGYIVIAFAAGQFIAMFSWTRVGDWLSGAGASGLRAIGLDGFPALLVALVMTALLSLVIFSGASLWAVLAPVLVPVFVGLGQHPATIQATYRVGDSVTHPISPLNPYLYMLEISAARYGTSFRLGTLISRLALFVLPVLVLWTGLLALFWFTGLPWGPGAPTTLGGTP